MNISDEEWAIVKRIVPRTIHSSFHCSIASLNADGSPHVTPIGSFSPTEKGKGVFFDAYNIRLSENVNRDPRVTIMALDSGPTTWFRAFMGGRFATPPGIRMVGTVGAQRESTPREIRRFHRLVGPLLRTKGGAKMWSSLPNARDVTIDHVIPIWLGSMTPDVPYASNTTNKNARNRGSSRPSKNSGNFS